MLLRLGAQAGDLPNETIDLWPENARVVTVFAALQTQWAVGGMGGVIGLRYEVLPAVLELLGVKPRHRRSVFRDLRVMEAAALHEIQENRGEHG